MVGSTGGGCALCQGPIVGAEVGVHADDLGWVHLRCVRDADLARLRRWKAALRACLTAVEAEGLWLDRARAGTAHEGTLVLRQWVRRREDLEALLFDRLGEFVGH